MKIRINLLPPQLKKAYNQRRIFRGSIVYIIYVSIAPIILIGGLIAIHFIIGTNLDIAKVTVANQISQRSYDDVKKAHGVFRETNVKVRIVHDLHKRHIEWTPVLRLLGTTMPSTVYIESIVTNGTKINIKGVAQSRNDVVNLKKVMAEAMIDGEACFDDVTIPDTDLVVANDATFSLEMTIARSCLGGTDSITDGIIDGDINKDDLSIAEKAIIDGLPKE